MSDRSFTRAQSNPDSNSTGLDFVWDQINPLDPLTDDFAYDFSAMVLANSATCGRYWHSERLTVWQAFALYCHLDPDALGSPLPDHLDFLGQVAQRLRPRDPLTQFCNQLPSIVAEVVAKRLPLLQERNEPLACIIDPRVFRDHLLSLGFQLKRPEGKLYCMLLPLKHDRLHEALRSFEVHWRASKTDPANADIKADVRESIKSGFICQAVARVVRPSNAKRGRRTGT